MTDIQSATADIRRRKKERRKRKKKEEEERKKPKYENKWSALFHNKLN